MQSQSFSNRLNRIAKRNQIEYEIDISVGGRLLFTPGDFYHTENRSAGEKATPANPIVHETNTLTEYLTVHYQNGNYEWFEFNFRVKDETAYLSSKTRVSNPNNGRGWIPPEVKDAIHEHHPDLKISSEKPPWWD